MHNRCPVLVLMCSPPRSMLGASPVAEGVLVDREHVSNSLTLSCELWASRTRAYVAVVSTPLDDSGASRDYRTTAFHK